MAPVISYIGPDGDYEDEFAWWTAVRTAENPAQWGVMLPGAVGVGGALQPMNPAVASATEYPRLYALPGSGVRGKIPQDIDRGPRMEGALEVRQPFFRIGIIDGEEGDGLYFRCTTKRAVAFLKAASPVADASGSRLDGCLIHIINPTQLSGVALQVAASGSSPLEDIIVRRNIIYVTGTPTSMTGSNSAVTLIATGGSVTTEMIFDHNTVIVDSSSATNDVERAVQLAPTTGNTLEWTGRNNYVSNALSGAAFNATAGTLTLTRSNNASNDGTADSVVGGDDNLNNIAAASQFVNSTSNWHLRASSSLRSAGVRVVDRDALGRLWGSTPDIGALKYEDTDYRNAFRGRGGLASRREARLTGRP